VRISGDFMKVEKLKRKEHGRTRKLWEEIFQEDDKAFLDYYYEYKTCKNQIYVIEEQGEICSMLHLNPYGVHMGEKCVKNVHYIVAVATIPSKRGQGFMKNLLHASLNHMAKGGEPFAFLMPIAEKIYTPFQFQTIYRQNKLQANNLERLIPKETSSEIFIKELNSSAENIDELVQFSKRMLKEKFQVYAERNRNYYETLLAEEKCQNGGILLFYEENKGEPIGYAFYESGEFIAIRELMIEAKELKAEILYRLNNYFENEKKKIVFLGFEPNLFLEDIEMSTTIMTRILNLESMMETVTAREKTIFTLGVKDEIIKENNGYFDFEIDADGGKIIKREAVASIESVPVVDIGDLTSYLFGVSKKNFPMLEEMRQINTFDKIFLNEVV